MATDHLVRNFTPVPDELDETDLRVTARALPPQLHGEAARTPPPTPEPAIDGPRRRRRLHRIAACAAVLLAACGSDGGDDAGEPPETTEPTTTTAVTTTTEPTSTTAPSTTTTEPDGGAVEIVFDFDKAWETDFADYGPRTGPDEPVAGLTDAVPGIDEPHTVLALGAANRSDDLFSFAYLPLPESLADGQAYDVEYRLEFWSNAPTGCFGVGGAPGESVWMKLGVLDTEPDTTTTDDGRVGTNFDKGGQSQGGEDVVVTGTIDNGIPCEQGLEDSTYALVTHDGTLNQPVATPDEGPLWVVVGFDSGFEATTTIYFDRLELQLTPTGGEQ